MYLAREGERQRHPSTGSGAPEVARRANNYGPICPHEPINMIYFHTHAPSYFIVTRPPRLMRAGGLWKSITKQYYFFLPIPTIPIFPILLLLHIFS